MNLIMEKQGEEEGVGKCRCVKDAVYKTMSGITIFLGAQSRAGWLSTNFQLFWRNA
jgi:hypothetical protein